MDIDSLTFSQVKEIASMVRQGPVEKSENALLKPLIGKYVLVRSRNEGVNAGVISAADRTGIALDDCRRLYYHAPKDESLSWYEGVAQSGLASKSRVSAASSKVIVEDYSITLCTAEAEKSIREFSSHEQS